MYIRKLELFKYKRFFLSNTELLIIEPTTNIQIILGQNGIGKSSLLNMLNPLPADLKKEFGEDGYKYIEIEHNGNVFKLKSGGDLGNKHSFICNDVEMNPGGTKSVQLELVKEYFKVTPYINSILLGTNRFTLMPYVERKSIFQDISNIDYKFSLNVYNKLKIRHRDILGGIKLLQDNIVKIKINILDNEEIEKYKNEVVILKEFIDHVVSLYNHNVVGKDNYFVIKNEIIDISKELKRTLKNNLDVVNKDVIKNEIAIINNNKITYNNNIVKLKEKISNNTIEGFKDISELENEITKQKENKRKFAEDVMFLEDVTEFNIENIYFAYREVMPDFISYLTELDDYYGIISKNEDVIKFKNEYEILCTRYKSKKELFDKSSIEYKHILSHKNSDNLVQCSGCGNEWYFKLDVKKEIELKKYLEDNEKVIVSLEKEIEVKKIELDKINSKLEIINNIKNFMKVNSILKPIFFYILKNLDIHSNRSTIYINELNKINLVLENSFNLYNGFSKLPELEHQLGTIQYANNLIKESNDKTVAELETELNDNIQNLYNDDIRLTKLNKQLNDVISIENNFYKLKRVLKSYNNSYKDSVELLRNDSIKKLSVELKNLMMDYENKINLNNQYLNKFNSDNDNLKDLIEREKILKLMLKELSPSEGLIAKSINSFLNVFIRDVNIIINKIWEYDLELLPCAVNEESDLDYKFSVKVDRSEIIEDVSKLSSSMQEIVDLAFRLVYIKYAKLIDMPLILDEFARTFDKVHQVKAYDVVETLFTENFKQIFIVSHFESMYGRFINSEVTILGSDENYKN